jgi:hypothetical protein
MYPPMMAAVPPPAQYQPVPSGLANAFTRADNPQPIPADFGPNYQGANAFTDAGAAMMSGAAPTIGGPPQPGTIAFARPGYGPPPGYMPAPGYGYGPPPGYAARPGYGPPAGYPAQPGYASYAPDRGQLMAALRGSLYPSERETAAEQLGRCDWRREPEVVQALVTAARNDPAPMVRACCVRTLAQLKVNTMPVVTTVQDLKKDADPRVRQAVEEALPVLMGQ